MLDATNRPFCPPDTPPTWIRPRHFRITHVVLAATVDIERQRIDGVVEHHVTLLTHGEGKRSIEFDAHDLTIGETTVDGKLTIPSQSADRLIIALAENGSDTLVVRIAFSVEQPQKGMFFIQGDKARGQVAMAWTQGAMEDHSFWFPAFDNPNNMSTYRFELRHRTPLTAIANGECLSRKDHGDGWSTTIYEQRKAHVLYLVNVAVGDFVGVDDVGGNVPVTHYVPRGHETGALAIFRATNFALRWLGDYIGVPFAWSRYGHVVVHGFMWGGMENTTLTTITDRALMDATIQQREDVNVDSLVVHELVHQWFGDLLTMKAWSDIWLNESFATYLEARGTAAWRASLNDGSEADVLGLELWNNKQAYLDEDSGRYRRPLVTNRYIDAYELFDRVAYEKGSLILHHLCAILGESRFRAALKLYTTRHAHDLVETADWRQAIEDTTGEPMDWFFEQWVMRAGHPTLKINWRHDPARAQVIIEVEQTQALSDAALCYRLPTTVAMLVNGVLTFTPITLLRAQDSFVVAASVAPTWVVIDPAGELPAVWDEAGSVDSFISQLNEAQLPVNARARAAVVLAKRHPSSVIITGLAKAILSGEPELVRLEAIAALGSLRTPMARDVLLGAWKTTPEPRLRRAIAKALGELRHDQHTAQQLEALLTDEPSLLTVGELLAARGACEFPGATPVLRAWLKRDSWNQRVRSATIRGMAASGEAPAIDEVLAILLDDTQCDAVISSAALATAQLGARHMLARDRIRVALERRCDHPSLMVRAATVKALGTLGDIRARGALNARLDREPFGNISRVIRESLQQLEKVAAVTTATAEMTKRIDTLEQAKDRLERRLESLEKRLEST